jgi:hypothetical protein
VTQTAAVPAHVTDAKRRRRRKSGRTTRRKEGLGGFEVDNGRHLSLDKLEVLFEDLSGYGLLPSSVGEFAQRRQCGNRARGRVSVAGDVCPGVVGDNDHQAEWKTQAGLATGSMHVVGEESMTATFFPRLALSHQASLRRDSLCISTDLFPQLKCQRGKHGMDTGLMIPVSTPAGTVDSSNLVRHPEGEDGGSLSVQDAWGLHECREPSSSGTTWQACWSIRSYLSPSHRDGDE